MPSYSTLSLHDLLDSFAAPSPIPGGGAAAAMAGATGVSLLLMVAGSPRTQSAASGTRLAEAIERLHAIREALTTLIDRDAEAYQFVLAATRPDAHVDARDSSSGQALGPAMRAATETQLDTLRACRAALAEAVVLATVGAPSARADLGVAIELLGAAGRGAGGTVAANLRRIDEPAYVDVVAAEVARLESEAAEDGERATQTLLSASGLPHRRRGGHPR
jgi:formiminotetrahydrofolate cyclodeaminase